MIQVERNGLSIDEWLTAIYQVLIGYSGIDPRNKNAPSWFYNKYRDRINTNWKYIPNELMTPIDDDVLLIKKSYGNYY